MVAGDLLVLAEPRSGDALKPVGEALVQVSASSLRQRLVRSIADQHMAESECLVAGEARPVGADHVLADERHQVPSDVGIPPTR